MDRILKVILKPQMVFIDVGANVGFVSLLASSTISSREGAVSTHCFEPDPTVYPWLSLNSELNPDLKMVINQIAIGSERGDGELTVSARSGWSTMAKEPPEGFTFLPKAGKVKVPVTTIDLYCSENMLTPGVIKIDVEGLEKQVLIGASATLRNSRPYIFIEINPLRLTAAGTSGEELIAQTVGFGYTLFHVDPSLAKNLNWLKRSNWLGLTEALPNDLVMGQDFDVIAVPTELLSEPI
jgi:FkbM family methyltransferase